MTTFDLADVRAFAADLDARRADCDHGEGNACATIEEKLLHYAKLCRDYRDAIRAWAGAIFSGQIEFDSAVETLLRTTGEDLRARASDVLERSGSAEVLCYVIEGRKPLAEALHDVSSLLDHWVTPARSIGLALKARASMTVDQIEEARQRLAALPPLPADWTPTDPELRKAFLREQGATRSLQHDASVVRDA